MLRDRPVTSFLLITFGVSYALGFPFNLVVSSIVGSSSLTGLYLPRFVTVIGPAVAAVPVAAAGAGVISVRQLVDSLRLRVGDVWWVIPCAVVGLVSAGGAFVLAGLPLDDLLNVVSTHTPLLLGHVLIQVTMIGLGEEIGWRGWLLPNLSANRSFAGATAFTGTVWTIWHLPVFFSGLSIAFFFVVLLASLSIVFSWLWYRTAKRTAVVALAHGFVNAPFFFLEQLVRPMAGGDAMTVEAFGYFAGCYGAMAFVLSISQSQIWRARPCG